MKKILWFSVIFCFLVGNAMALSLPWIPGVVNNFEDNNVEQQNIDENNNGVLDLGDTLKGVATWNEITDPDNYLINVSGFELSTIFEVEVIAKTNKQTLPVDADGDGNINLAGVDFLADFYSYTFGPTASFEAIYGSGAVAAFYLDDTINLDPLNDSPAAAYANATDGELYWVFGLLGDGDWSLASGPEDTGIFQNVANQINVASTNVALDQLVGVGSGPTLLSFGKTGFTNIELWFNTTLEGVSNTDINGNPIAGSVTDFDLRTNTQASIRPVPEPGTMILLGAGLIGLAGLGRKKYRMKS